MKPFLRFALFLVGWLLLANGESWAQTVVNKAAPIIPKSIGATLIKPLQSTAATTNSGALVQYRIVAIPSSGSLRTSPTGTNLAANAIITIANADNLYYVPNSGGAAGNYFFTYRAEFVNGNTGNATYSLPVSNAVCSQNSAIDFSERNTGENWKAQAGVTVANTTVSTTGYASSVPAGQTNILQISDQPARLSTKGLVWQLDNANVGAGVPNVATVEMNFSRPVRNLAFAMEDIDISTLATGGSDFVDEVTFNAYAIGSNTPYTLTAADVAVGSNGSNTFVAGTNTVKGTGVNSGPAGTVVLTYPAGVAISRLEIVYRNTQTYTANNLRLQTIGIPSMVWCAEIDLVTTLSGPARVQAGQPVAYVATTRNQGDFDAAGVAASVQLIPNLANVTVNNLTTGFTYNATSGLLTYTVGALAIAASDTRTIRFTMPATGSVTGTASSTTTGLDIEPANNNGSQANANVTTIQNRPPVVTDVIAPAMPNTNAATPIPALQGTDPDGNNTIVSYLLTNLPLTTQGVITFTRGAATVTLLPGNTSSLANRTLTPAEMATLRFDPAGGFAGNAAFNYSATDDFGIVSNTATYTLPVGPIADVATSITPSPATTVNAGAALSFAVVFTNNGPSNAAGYTRTLQLTPGLGVGNVTFSNLAGGTSAIYNNADGTVTLVGTPITLNNTGSRNLTVNIASVPASFTSVTASSTTSTATADNVLSNNTASATVNVTPIADVATSIVPTPSPVNAGGALSFAVTYTNNGPNTAAGYNRTLQLPAGLGAGNVSFTNLPAGVTASYNDADGTVTFTGTPAALASGANQNLTVNIASVPASFASVTASSTTSTTTSENGVTANNTASATVNVTPIADVATSLTGPASILQGQATGNFTAVFANNGPSSAATVTRKVTLPTGATLTTAQQNTITAAYPGTTFATTGSGATAVTTITFPQLATQATGGTASFVFAFTAPAAAGNVTIASNTTTTTSQNGATANDVSTLNLTVAPVADVATSIVPTPSPVNAGGALSFAVTYTNNGPSPAAGYNRTLQLPAGLGAGNVSFTNLPAGVTASYNDADGTVTFTGTPAALASGANQNLTVNIASVPASFASVTASSTTSTTTSENGATANNTASATVNVTPIADVATSISASANPVDAADPLTLTLTFTNNGPSTAVGYTRSVTLPAGLGTGVTVSGGTYNNGTGAVTFTTPPTTLASGASANVTVTIPSVPTSFSTIAVATSTSTTTSQNGITANDNATLNVAVTPIADVTTTIAGPVNLVPGLPSGTYTAAFTNNGPSTAATVTQQVTLPTGATNVFVNGVAFTPVNGVIDFGTAGTLGTGATNTFNFSFTAPATVGSVDIVSNVSTATSEGANAASNSATLNATVLNTADVVVTIAPAAATVTAGQTGTFNVTFSNNGPADAAGVVARVQLPAGLTGVTVSGNGSYSVTTGLVTYTNISPLASGASTSSVITFTAPTTSPVTATASIFTTTNEGGQKANNVANASIDITPTFDVTTLITGPAITAVGVQTTFSIATINNGPSAAPNVVQTVTGLPTNLTNVYVSNGGIYNAAAGTVTFPGLGTLANAARVDNTISFTPTAVSAAGFTATATVTANGNNANDSNLANNSVPATTMVVNAAPAAATNANLYTLISAPAANVLPGATTTFTVITGNNGPGTATTVAQLVTLPAGLTGVVVKDNLGAVLPGAYNPTTGVVTFPTVASLLSSNSVQYTIDLVAPATGIIAAVATVSAATADIMPSNNIATADVTVTPITDVLVRLTGPNRAPAGSLATYTVTTTNNGPATATNVATAVSIPAGLTGVVVSGGGSYDAMTGVVTFPASTTLLNGVSVVNTIEYRTPNAGTFANVASVTSTTTDNVAANNTAAVTTVTEASTDVTVAISGPATVTQGGQVQYVVSSFNNGPLIADGSQVRVQLPANLTGVLVVGGGIYDAATGIVLFNAINNQAAGVDGAVSYVIRFNAPASLTSLYAVASITTIDEETSYANNTVSVVTTILPAVAGSVNLRTTVVQSPIPVVAGDDLTLTVSTINASGTAGTNVVQRVVLEAGQTVKSITNGGTYDALTGVVTFPTLAALAGNTTVENTIVLVTPGADALAVRALVAGDQPDPTLGNNVVSITIDITVATDITTRVSGPATAQPGELVTYSVVALNNGPSSATAVSQTVTLPAGATNIVAAGGVITGNTVTYTLNTVLAGADGQRINTITFNAPAGFAASFDVTSNVTTTRTQTAAGLTNDDATFTTFKTNIAPVANAVTNVLFGPGGNTAIAQAISPLSGSDADGNATIASYTITTIPTAAEGVLSLNDEPVLANQIIAVADIANLTFDPNSNFVGNAFFTYTVLDNAGATSAPAIYTIPVGQDLTVLYTATPMKGGNTNTYSNGDVIAYGIDPNTAIYNTAGRLYNADGTFAAGTVNNGIRFGKLSETDSTTLAAVGIRYTSGTGLFTVINRDLLPINGRSIPVTITTVDLFGGISVVPFNIALGNAPLPVELVAFTAQAVKNVDAQLNWRTASELNNAFFDVERSLNGKDFVKFGQVAGQGTTSSATAYALTDAGIGSKASGLVYYRLRQVDVDGTATYSPVRTVAFTKNAAIVPAISLFPNPATADTKLDLSQLPAGTYQVSILDATGRVVIGSTLNAGLAHVLELKTIASGTYTVLVRGQNGGQVVNLTKRLIKE